MRKKTQNIFTTKLACSFKRTSWSNQAVSEVVGVVLLLGIIGAFMAALTLVMYDPFSSTGNESPAVELVGVVENDESGSSYIYFEHRGGPPLSGNVQITLTYEDSDHEFLVQDLLPGGDENNDGYWNMGEQLTYSVWPMGGGGTQINVVGLLVKALIIDPTLNTVLLNSVLQDGLTGIYPYITGISAVPLSDEATLTLTYNRRTYVGATHVCFQYREWSSTPGSTPWIPPESPPALGHSGWEEIPLAPPTTGSWDDTITNLAPNTKYDYRAWIRYQNIYTPADAYDFTGTKSFTTGGNVIGQWHFEENVNNKAWDETTYENHGDVYGAQWVSGVPSPVGSEEALEFDGIDDQVIVPYKPCLDLEDKLSIEAWLKPYDDNTMGDITAQKLEDSAFPITSPDCHDPDIIHVSGDVYAIACRGTSHDGYLITVTITDQGAITNNHDIVDSMRFTWVSDYPPAGVNHDCYKPRIIHVSDQGSYQVFAIVYSTSASNTGGYLITVAINNDGTIQKGATFAGDLLKFRQSGENCFDPYITHINGDVYAIVYGYQNKDRGHLITVTISAVGEIQDTIVETLSYDSDTANEEPNEYCTLFHVNGDIYGIGFSGKDQDGNIVTVKIPDSGVGLERKTFDAYDLDSAHSMSFVHIGDITHLSTSCQLFAVAYNHYEGTSSYVKINYVIISNDGLFIYKDLSAVIDLYESTSGGYFETEMIRVDDNTLAVIYRQYSSYGMIQTVDIDINTRAITPVDSELFARSCALPSVIKLGTNTDNNYFAIAYKGAGYDGVIKTIEIQDNGTIVLPCIDTLELGYFCWYDPDMVHVANDIYAIAYSDLDYHGVLRTIKINSNGVIDETVNSYKFEDEYNWYGTKILPVAGDYFAVFYRGPSGKLNICTLQISNDGQTITFVDAASFTSLSIYVHSDVIEVTESISNKKTYAVVYTTSSIMKIATISIDETNGDIDRNPIDTESFTMVDECYYPSITQVYSTTDPSITQNIYALAFNMKVSGKYYGHVKTVEITDEGLINDIVDPNSQFRFQEHDTYANSYYPAILSATNGYCILASNIREKPGTSYLYNGTIHTIHIDQDGLIQQQVIDELYKGSDFQFVYPQLIHIKDEVYAAVTYPKYLYLFKVGTENGDLSDDYVKKLEIHATAVNPATMLQTTQNPDLYAILHRAGNGGDDAYVTTVEITTSYTTTTKAIVAKHDTSSSLGFGLYIDNTNIYVKINGLTFTQPFTPAEPDKWNYIVLTYDKDANSDNINLYINGEVKLSEDYDAGINSHQDELIFGLFNGLLDEITIWDKPLESEDIQTTWTEYLASLPPP
ncbi:MAG: type IV pilin [Candidatus Thermoplasmatota archaeon]|nr:type IV pilin [Candidatus Thermoplasmatota archaeon]